MTLPLFLPFSPVWISIEKKRGNVNYMKSSTLHRSNLSRERMSMIENVKPVMYGDATVDVKQYAKLQNKPELNVLWRDFEKSIQTRQRTKAPIVYAGIGFVLGLIFAFGIAIIIGLSMYPDIKKSDYITTEIQPTVDKAPISVVPSSVDESNTTNVISSEEKYTIKEGDTLDKIAYRFYGKYDPDKIEEIKKLNNIKDETTIQIGQVLIIPLN